MLWELSLGVRLALLAALALFTIWYTMSGLQNGIRLFLVTALWPMIQGTLFRAGGGLPNVTLERVVWPLVLLIFLLQWRRGEIDRQLPDSIEWCMFTLLMVTLVNMYLHTTSVTSQRGTERVQFFTVLSAAVLPFMCYFIMRRVVFTEAHVESFLTGVSLITIYLGLTSLGEAWHQSWLVYPKYILDPKQGIHFGYARGPLLNASFNGLSMAMGLPILLWLFLRRRDASRWLWLLGIAAVVLSLPHVFQRAAWLGAAAALGTTALGWPKRRSILIIAGLLIAAVGGLLVPETLEKRLHTKWENPGNIVWRLKLIKSTQAIIKDHLVAGVGFDRFDDVIRRYGVPKWETSHNTPLTLFAELGLFGFLPYVLIFSLLLFKSAKAYWEQPWSRGLIAGFWGITAAYMIMAISVEMRFVLYPNVLFFSLWGLLMGMIQRQSALPQERRATYQRVVSFI
jgi:hypothetical protein